MTISTFDVNLDDCFGDDYGIYFGSHYWFIAGYTPVSSHNKIAAAKIRCHIDNLCPAGERQVIDIGETIRFDAGYDVRVNSLTINDLNTEANITVTEVYVDPCFGVECPDYCDYENHIKYYDGICVDGQCEYNIEENSVECGYTTPDPCEGVVCNPICVEYDLYSQICTEGSCITDQLLEYNSLDCEYIESEPSNIIFYGTLGLAALIGLKLLSKK